jgi:hypothetical protein
MEPEMQEGMRLRGRQLPGAVPVVPPCEPQAETPYRHSVQAIWGTIRKKLTDIFSAMILNTTSYEEVPMEETITVPTTEQQRARTSIPAPQEQERGQLVIMVQL